MTASRLLRIFFLPFFLGTLLFCQPCELIAEDDSHGSSHGDEQMQEQSGTDESTPLSTEPKMPQPESPVCDPPVPVVLELFKSPTALVRQFGAERLILCKFGARPAIDGLKALLKDESLEVRMAAARALAGTKSSQMPVSELLSLFVANLNHQSLYIRRKAASGLAILTDPPPLGETYRVSIPEARFVIRSMVKVAGDPDGVIMAGIAHTFGNLKVASVLPILEDMTQSSYWQVRREAVIALGRFESKARQYSPSVAKVLVNDKNRDVRKAAANTLLSFGNGNAVGEVKKCAVSGGKAPYENIYDYCLRLQSTYAID